MPSQACRVSSREREIEVLLPLDPFGCSEHKHLARGVPWPFVRGAIVSHSHIVNLALLHQGNRLQYHRWGNGIERPNLILLAPNPAPALTLLPAAHRSLLSLEFIRFKDRIASE